MNSEFTNSRLYVVQPMLATGTVGPLADVRIGLGKERGPRPSPVERPLQASAVGGEADAVEFHVWSSRNPMGLGSCVPRARSHEISSPEKR